MPWENSSICESFMNHRVCPVPWSCCSFQKKKKKLCFPTIFGYVELPTGIIKSWNVLSKCLCQLFHEILLDKAFCFSLTVLGSSEKDDLFGCCAHSTCPKDISLDRRSFQHCLDDVFASFQGETTVYVHRYRLSILTWTHGIISKILDSLIQENVSSATV